MVAPLLCGVGCQPVSHHASDERHKEPRTIKIASRVKHLVAGFTRFQTRLFTTYSQPFVDSCFRLKRAQHSQRVFSVQEKNRAIAKFFPVRASLRRDAGKTLPEHFRNTDGTKTLCSVGNNVGVTLDSEASSAVKKQGRRTCRPCRVDGGTAV
jgi:hypothetical protein